MSWNRNHPRQLKNSETSIDAALRTNSGNSDVEGMDSFNAYNGVVLFNSIVWIQP